MRSEAETVEQYLEALPEGRRATIQRVRDTILASLPEGYEEAMNWGMVTYQVPPEVCPNTYNDQPLMYAALASQDDYMVVYLSAIYADDEARTHFEKAYKSSGKRYDVGKSCVRFRTLDDLPLDVLGEAIGSVPLDDFVASYQAGRRVPRRSRAKKG
jgi:hypothetical protein